MIQGAKVVHHIPGRLRVRLPRSQRDPVRQVEINPMTGSLLVRYEPDRTTRFRICSAARWRHLRHRRNSTPRTN